MTTPFEPKPPERPVSEYRAVKYRGFKITVTLPGIGDRTWNANNLKLVDATDWPESVMDMFRNHPDWQIIEGYKAAG